MLKFVQSMAASILLASASFAGAISAPSEVLEKLSSSVIAEINQHQTEIKDDAKAIYPIVNALIIPYVDFEEMSQWVAGRNAWLKASREDKKEFINEFKKLIISTYAKALASYSNQKIEYLPIRGNVAEKNRVIVNSIIRESGKQALHIDYKMIKNQTWQVYDILIEGVSLIKGYQSQFSDDIRKSGLKFATQKMRTHNQQLS